MNGFVVCALLIFALDSHHHQAVGFSTPRPSTTTTTAKTLDSDVAASWKYPDPQSGVRCSISGGRRRISEGKCLLAASDETESSSEEEEPEFETEASSTGLFIPGFSDKFSPPPPEPEKPNPVTAKKEPEPNRTPTITISSPITSNAPTESSSVPPPPKSPPVKVKDLSEDVSRSVIDLPSFPAVPKLSLPLFGRDQKKKPSPPSKPPPRSKTEDAIAAAVGGTLAGAIVGLYADIATDILMDTDLPPLVPPVVLGVALGAGAFVGANQENVIGQAIRFIFGRPVLGVKNKITNKITETVEDIKATPTRIKDAAVQKVEDVVDEIKATPGKIKDAAIQKVEDAVDEIKVSIFSHP
jgi:hypothetical protein